MNYRNRKFNSFSFLPSVLFPTFCTKQMTIHLTVKLNICGHFILRRSTYNILVSLLLHVGRELYKPKLMGCDGTSFPGRGWLSLDHVTARNRCRWFSGIRRLRKRFDILWRSWLQTRLPELLKTGHLLFSLCNAEQIYQASRHSSTTMVTVSISIYLCFFNHIDIHFYFYDYFSLLNKGHITLIDELFTGKIFEYVFTMWFYLPFSFLSETVVCKI